MFIKCNCHVFFLLAYEQNRWSTMWKQRGLIFPVQWVHVSETLHILCHFFGCYGHFILQQITRSGTRLRLDCRKFNVFAECLRCKKFLFYLNAVFKYTLWKLSFFLPSSLCLKSMPSLCLHLMFGKTIHNCQTWSCVLVKQYFNPLTENKQMPL